MSEFPEDFLSHAAAAKLGAPQFTGAHFGGLGTVIVYDSQYRCYRTILPDDQHTISEPEQVVVCGYSDIELALAWAAEPTTIQELTDSLTAESMRHLTTWADTERLAGLAPIMAARRTMAWHGFHIDRRSHLGRTEAGALTTTDFFTFREAPALLIVFHHTIAAGDAGESTVRVWLLDCGTQVAEWNGATRAETACARACGISAAVHRYLGH